MDTEYTKGFKAGLAWQLEATIKKLEEIDDWFGHSPDSIIELIKGETNE